MFVNYTKENLQNEFVKKMLHKENFESIMQEDTGFYKEHNKLVEKKKVRINSLFIYFYTTSIFLLTLKFR